MTKWIAKIDTSNVPLPPPISFNAEAIDTAVLVGWNEPGPWIPEYIDPVTGEVVPGHYGPAIPNGTWREITDDELRVLQLPSQEEQYYTERNEVSKNEVSKMYDALVNAAHETWISALNENPQPTLKIQGLVRTYNQIVADMYTALTAVDTKYGVATPVNGATPVNCPYCAIPFHTRMVFGKEMYYCEKCGQQWDPIDMPTPPEVIETADDLEADLHTAVRMYLDGFARERGYDTIVMARQAEGPFADDGVLANLAYDTTWTYILDNGLIDLVRAGTLTVQQVLDQLPPISWDTPVPPVPTDYATEEELQAHTSNNVIHVSPAQATYIATIPQLEVGINTINKTANQASSDITTHLANDSLHLTTTDHTNINKVPTLQTDLNNLITTTNAHLVDSVSHLTSGEHAALTELIAGGGGGDDVEIGWELWQSGDWDMSSTYVDFPSALPSELAEVLIRFTFAIPYSDPESSYHTSAEWVMRADAYRRGAFGLSAVVRKFTGSGYSAYTAGFSVDVSSSRFIVNQVLPSDCVLEKYAIYTRKPIIIPGGSAAAATMDLQDHKTADMSRWNEFYQLKKDFYDLKASIQNKALDTSSIVDIETDAQGAGYTVTNSLGGRVTFTDVIVLLDLIPGSVSVNGAVVWSGQALGVGTIEDHVDVQLNDVITCTGITSITFTPYIGV